MSANLAELERRMRSHIDHGVLAHRQNAGMGEARYDLNQATREWLADNDYKREHYNGRRGFTLADKYADAPPFSMSPYRTSVLYASGKAGRRGMTERVHGARPSTTA